MNIAHLLLGAAQDFRDVTALARGEAAYLSYRDLWRKVSVMSTHLRVRFGLGPGDRVAFAMTNCVESLEVMQRGSGCGRRSARKSAAPAKGESACAVCDVRKRLGAATKSRPY